MRIIRKIVDSKKYANMIGGYNEKYIFIGAFWLEIIGEINNFENLYKKNKEKQKKCSKHLNFEEMIQLLFQQKL